LMHLIPVDQIRVRDNRNRKIFTKDQLQLLAESLASSTGLIQLPVVRLAEDGKRELLAGERRMRAMQLLWTAGRTFSYMNEEVPLGQLPHALISEVDDLTARAIELEENIRRVDLTWQERVTAIAAFHVLQVARNPEQSLSDTSIELGYRPSYPIKNATILAKHLNDPDIARAKTPHEAMKLLSRKVEREFRAEAIVAHFESGQLGKHFLHLASVEDFLPTLPAASFDVILTDPPYGVNAETFHANMTLFHEYDDDWESTQHKLYVLAVEGFRVAKQQAHAYVFCDVLTFSAVAEIFNEAGWSVWPRPLIWSKDVGHIPNAQLGPRRQYECFLYANKGNRPVIMLYPDVISCPTVKDKLHAAQKPVDLFVNILRRSVNPGDTVLDPFCGTGTVFEAAERCQCVATGCDDDASCVQIAQERMKAL